MYLEIPTRTQLTCAKARQEEGMGGSRERESNMFNARVTWDMATDPSVFCRPHLEVYRLCPDIFSPDLSWFDGGLRDKFAGSIFGSGCSGGGCLASEAALLEYL